MDDGVGLNAPHQRAEIGVRRHVDLVEAEASRRMRGIQILPTPRPEIIHPRYRMICGEELIRGVTADETGGTGE
jgi:hypothetical protein